MFLADIYLYTARYLYNSRFLGGEPAQFFPIFPSFGIFRGGKIGTEKNWEKLGIWEKWDNNIIIIIDNNNN